MSKYLLLKATAEANKWAQWYFSDKHESLDIINNAKRLFIQKYIDSYKVK
jgi:hypothetical protein